jgi:heme A synthase
VIWLHRYIKLLVAATVFLIAAGGMVTSTDSGLAVPDWPNTYGQFMFSFPLEKMVGGIFYEHGHRMIASTVGFLTIILAIWTRKADPRRWVGKLGITALGAVILQGLLGGITVLLLLPAPVSIGHAGLAQLFFCLTISLALFTSPGWTKSQTAVDDPTLRRIAVATTVMVYCQIILGATMRHIDSGLSAGVRASRAAVLECRSRRAFRASGRRRPRHDRDSRDGGARLVPSPYTPRAGPASYAPGAPDRDPDLPRRLRHLVRPAADHQHRARRQRRAGAGDIARADAAELQMSFQ